MEVARDGGRAVAARLRRALGDDLFVRGPEGMSPTPRALDLAGPVRRALAEIEGALQQDRFDPPSSTARFRLVLNNTANALIRSMGTALTACR